MNGPEHYRMAEGLAARFASDGAADMSVDRAQFLVSLAQVHATLALAADRYWQPDGGPQLFGYTQGQTALPTSAQVQYARAFLNGDLFDPTRPMPVVAFDLAREIIERSDS